MRRELNRRPARSYRVQALARGLSVLNTFRGGESLLSLSELAERTQLPLPTVFRLVATLEDSGYLDRVEGDAYRPGMPLIALSRAALRGSSLVQISEAPLQRLAATTHQTINLAVLSGKDILYLIRIMNSDLVTANLRVGSTLPAIYTSMGKMLLAEMPSKIRANVLDDADFSHPPGPKSVKSKAQLITQVKRFRTTGLAHQDEEVARGLRSIAAPIYNDEKRCVAAANIAVRASDFTIKQLHHQFAESLRDCVHTISARLANL